ncbi:tRNA lysidine(34) synthetase TilS [bacterium]|jgi:tRNA(Ile)-lysidine synthase|nr:tRNA lysidine(34) synthetase TilS [bacterium]
MEVNPFEIIKNSISNHNLFKKTDTLLVSFSGGPDSVFLMKALKKLHTGPLIYVHFVHGLRLSDEKKEAALLKEIERKNNILIITRRIPTKAYAKKFGVSIEHAGRLLRHSFLIHFSNLKKASHIVTGHHFDDHVETYLLKKQRGSTYPIGLNFKAHLYNKSFIKPLLEINKKTILKTLNTDNEIFIKDPSNDNLIYERNIIRHSTQPTASKIKLILKDIKNNLLTSKNLKERTSLLINRINVKRNEFSISTKFLETTDQGECKFFLNSFIHFVFSSKKTKKKLITPSSVHSSKHIDSIYDALKKHNTKLTSFKLNIPNFHTVQINKNILKIYSEKRDNKHPLQNKNKITNDLVINFENLTEAKSPSAYDFNDYKIEITLMKSPHIKEASEKIPLINQKTTLSDKTSFIYKSKAPNSSNSGFIESISFYDFETIKDNSLIIRTRKSNEKITTFGNQTKTLKKYFIDAKIPQEFRQSVPLFFIENTLVWIGGFQRSKHYKITKNTKQILKIELIKKNHK